MYAPNLITCFSALCALRSAFCVLRSADSDCGGDFGRNLSWPTFYDQILHCDHFFSQPITTLGEVVFENDSSNHCHLSVAPHGHIPPGRMLES